MKSFIKQLKMLVYSKCQTKKVKKLRFIRRVKKHGLPAFYNPN